MPATVTTVSLRIDGGKATQVNLQAGCMAGRADKPRPAAWLRPRLTHRHHQLFREPVYEDGQPYSHDDEDETDG